MAKEKTANSAETLKSSNKNHGSKASAKEGRGLINYLKGVRQETNKVVCPTKDELTTDTVVVLATCAFFALAFWLIDTGFLAALKGVLGVTLS